MKRMLEEQETIFSMSADNRQEFHCFCDDPVWQRRIEAAGIEAIRVTADGTGKEYKIPVNQLKLRKPMSEEARERRAAILAAHREARKVSVNSMVEKDIEGYR